MEKKNSKSTPETYQNYQYYSPNPPKKGGLNKRAPQKYPNWMNKMPGFQKFMKLSRRRKIMLGAGVGVSVLAVITIFTTIYFASTLGSKENIMNRNKTGVTLTDVNGKDFYEFYNARSETYVALDDVAPVVPKALISAEDKNFYNHRGFSPLGITNAVWQNLKPGGLDSGGSTITQQLVKNALLTKDRSLLRKYQELVLSIEIERRYSKEEILEMYLNSVYFGEGAFGIEDAAQTYFGVSAKELDTAQASVLVGILPAPSAWSPISGNRESTERRQDYVLGRMQEDGAITVAEQKKADAQKLTYAEQNGEDYQAPHFALMVRDALIKQYATGLRDEEQSEEYIARSGFKVKNTLNLDWQNTAEEAVKSQVEALAGNNVSNGAAIVIDPKTGEVRALVGSVDYSNNEFGKLNITTADRQPGSSFKPFVYATGIEQKELTAGTILHDKLTDFGGGYTPQNYDLRFRGDVTLRRSLANSLNVPAVEAMQIVGIADVTEQVRELGLSTIDPDGDYGLSLALGSGEAKLTEMTNAYATFANQGRKNDLTLYTSITDKENNEIFKSEKKNERVISDETAYIMSNIMSDNAARAETFGASLSIDRPAAVKTGTTENYRDAWTIGYTPSTTVGVWIGNNDGELMSSVAGSSGAAPIWRNIMLGIHAGKSAEQFEMPSSILIRDFCTSNGGVATRAGTNTVKEYFRPGTVPTTSCDAKQKKEPKKEKPKEEETNEEENTEEEVPIEEPPTEEEPTDPGAGGDTGGNTGGGTGGGGPLNLPGRGNNNN